MKNLRLAVLLILCGAGCADPDGPAVEALPSLAVRALDALPGANYVATFVPGQLQPQPDARARTADSIGWRSWSALAARLNLEPFDDASLVAVTAFVGSCGANDDAVVVVPAGDAALFAARVAAAVDDRRRQHPAPPADERWVTLADGRCTVLDGEDFQSVAVTLRDTGLLELRAGFSGIGCAPGPEGEALPPEALEATWLAGRSLAKGWDVESAPAMVEAMPDGAEVTWADGKHSLH